MQVWGSQPRLAVITKTLTDATAPLMEFFVVVAGLLALLAALGNVCFGDRAADVSNFRRAFVFGLEFIVTGT